MNNQPGIILYRQEYANIRNILTQEQKGYLLDALMDYSETGEEYQGEDPAVSIAFSFFAAAIRRSGQKYRNRCRANTENIRKRWTDRIKEAETHEDRDPLKAPDPDGTPVDTEKCECLPEDAGGCEYMPEEADGYKNVPADEDESVNGCESIPADTNKYENVPVDTHEYERRETKTKTKTKQKRNIYIPPSVDEVAAYCQERGNKIDPERFTDFYAARGWELKPGQKMKDWRAAVRTWEKNQKEWINHGLHGTEGRNSVSEQRELYGL